MDRPPRVVRWMGLGGAFVVAACGRVGFDTGGFRFSEFSQPTILDVVNTGRDDDPAMTLDELEIFVTSNINGSCDVFSATREPGGVFPTPSEVMEVSTNGCDATASVSADGLTMMFARRPVGASAFDLFEATRASRESPWQSPVPIVELNTADEGEAGPSLTEDGLMLLYYNETFDHLYEARRDAIGQPWSSRVVTELDVGLQAARTSRTMGSPSGS